MKMPVDAVVAVTFRCNGRCIMCNIWRAAASSEVRPGAYRALPASLRYVNVTGGEPFLRQDLPEIISQLVQSCPRAKIVISTNGLLPQKIREDVEQILRICPDIGVAVSIDGIQGVHDRVRGVKGAYGKALEAIDVLKEVGVRGVRVAFTATPENVSHLRKVYELSRELGVEFTCAIAHCSPHYFMTAEGSFAIPPSVLRAELEPVIREELRTAFVGLKRWARAYFLAGLLRFAEGSGRMLPCTAGVDTVFISPVGDVHPCNVFCGKMGNISESSFENLWRSESAEAVRTRLAGCRDGCWMICSARMPMRRHPLRVGAWILRHKLFARRMLV